MPRAVMPWTWIRAIRDHGPKDHYFWAAMSALFTHMQGKSGECFVGVELWAREARINGRTLRKCRDKGIELGWLHCSDVIRARTKTIYRACIPDGLDLGEKHEELNLIAADYGEIEETVASRVPQNSQICSTQSATDSKPTGDDVPQNGHDPKSVALSTSENRNLWYSATKSVALAEKSVALFDKSVAPRVPYKSEVLLQKLSTEVEEKAEATALPRSGAVLGTLIEKSSKAEEPPPPATPSPEQKELILKAIQDRPTFSDKEIADVPLAGTGITREMVRSCRPRRKRLPTDAEISKRFGNMY